MILRKESTTNATIAARDTPAGRRREVAIVSIDCLILVIGCLGLALAFPPLIYAAALGHLIAGFMLAIGKWFWAISSLVITGAATVLFAGGEYQRGSA